jgi:hypothetical protein
MIFWRTHSPPNFKRATLPAAFSLCFKSKSKSSIDLKAMTTS